MTNTSRNVRHAVRLALAACATSASGPLVYAQTAPAPAAPVEEVVVTGSRLLQAPNDISISPVTSVNAADIQQTGLIRVEDILGSLPQVGAEQSSGQSIAALGVATVSLRSLGSQRTLVLVGGRRMNPGGAGGVSGGNANAADINQIPAALIERADVLTGGASAVYGADAVAGVVNFVLNTHYQGVKVDANYSFNNHKNDNATYLGYLTAFGAQLPQSTANTGQNRDVSILAGANFADGKGNATVYATYLNSSPAVGYQFDHAGCTITGGGTPTSTLHCGGSGTSAHGHIIMSGVGTTLVSDAVDPATGVLRPFARPGDEYNYGALSYFQRAAERYTAGAFLHYDVNEHASVYTETMYARNTSTAQYGPSGSFFQTATVGCPGVAGSVPGGGGITGNVDPLINAQEASVLCTPANIASNQALYGNITGNQITLYVARRSVESGGRLDNYASNSIRQVAGVKGAINDVWSYDAYGQVGITQLEDIEGNFLGSQQITRSLQVVTGPNGQPTCTSVLNGTDTACVPWNVWKPNGVTQAQLDYLRIPATWASTTKEYITDASVTGDLGKYGAQLPSAASGLNVALGTEYRGEKFDFSPDYVYANGLNAGGAPSLPIHGQFHVWEAFTEARLPLVDDKPGAYKLSLDAGYRYSSYTLGFNTNTYKFGLEWAPVQDVRLRGGYNRAVRAPNLDELFAPAAVGSGGVADPCWGSAPVLTQAECALTGVSAARYGHLSTNSAAQINTQTAGNPTLTPEIADTYTLGLVIQPQAIPNLVASIDAFNIKIKNTITAISPTTIVLDCGLGIDPALCSHIHRSPGSQSLWLATNGFVDTTTQNVGINSTKGLDATAHYRLDIGKAGRLGFGLAGTYTKAFTIQPDPNGGAYDCVGLFGGTCGFPLPKWRHVFTTNWGAPWAGLDVTLRWRHIGSADVDRSSSNRQLSSGFYTAVGHFAAYNYLDLSASVPIGQSADFRLGINNIADKNPPLVPTGTLSNCPTASCNDNTFVGTYDTLGRYIFAHVGVKF